VTSASALALILFVEMEVTAVFSFAEDLASFGEDRRRRLRRLRYRPALGKEVRLLPILPRLERLTLDFGGEPDAEPLIDMQPDDLDFRTAGEVCPVFPERPVGRVVVLTDSEFLDRSLLGLARARRFAALSALSGEVHA
jgi:hypothetical protein